MLDAECVHFLSSGVEGGHEADMANGKHVKKMAVGGKCGYRAGVQQEPYTKWDADKDEIEVDYKQLDGSSPPSWFSGAKGTLLKVLLVVTTFLVGIVIGYAAHRSVTHKEHAGVCSTLIYQGYSRAVSERLTSLIQADNIELNLKNYTSKVHVAATKDNTLLGNRLKQQLQEFGLDVREATYNVLLSYPDWSKEASAVTLLNTAGEVQFSTDYRGPPQEYLPQNRRPYNAFAPNGSFEGEIIYANYGEESDFATLMQQGLSCNESIVIMKYGRIFRGFKVKNAEKCGAKGALLYSDPRDVTGLHHERGDVFPNTWYLPEWAAQDGSILPRIDGDPLTPGLPSVPFMHRVEDAEAGLPSIPTLPISWGDAENILMYMGGPSGGSEFEGSLHHNVTYRLGPGYAAPRQGWKLRLEVNNEMERRDIRNIIGTMRGDREPDRYVVVGCHYDAWTYGGVDPNSGTSLVTELARAFSQLATTSGWKPHRTLIFAHFDAEEMGLMGSYEWVEEHEKELAERTVIFINLDGAVRGNWSLDVQASPLLQDVMYGVTRMFRAVTSDRLTVYGEWRANQARDARHLVKPIGGGSDHAPFHFILGVPCMWPRYFHNIHKFSSASYPAYHSFIDSFDYVKTFVDPQFKAHQVLGQVVGELLLQLVTKPKLPFNATALAQQLGELCDDLEAGLQPIDNPPVDILLEQLNYAIGNFSIIAFDFHDRFEQVDENNVLEVRQYNDRLLRLQQAFIHSPGLPGRPMFRNILFAPSAVDSHGGVTFTGIYDAYKLYKDSAQSPTGSASSDTAATDSLWAEVERQFSIAILSVNAAMDVLRDAILS